MQVTSGKAQQILHSPVISRLLTDPSRSDELVSTYFDTPDLCLRQHGTSLRVRAIDEQRLQTLKLNGTVHAGLFERDESEGPVPDRESA